MPFNTPFLAHKYFPASAEAVPFGEKLNELFFLPRSDNDDYPIHGPNVIRFTRALLLLDDASSSDINRSGLFQTQEAERTYKAAYYDILGAVGVPPDARGREFDQVCDIMTVAALYHDIGKIIRRQNHPQVGEHLLRHSDEHERRRLLDALKYPEETNGSAPHDRFSLLCSITRHHDTFGVVSSGEGALPIFSDMIYFASDAEALQEMKKTITCIMLLTLADIAAVTKASLQEKEEVLTFAGALHQYRTGHAQDASESDHVRRIVDIMERPSSCLGLTQRKVKNVVEDWKQLMQAIQDEDKRVINRVTLKQRLFERERNPRRTVERISRLLWECAEASRAEPLSPFVTLSSVESDLVGALGSHRFQAFCQQFSAVVKLDYGQRFFQAVLCGCVRHALGDRRRKRELPDLLALSKQENEQLGRLSHHEMHEVATHTTTALINILDRLVSIYAGVLDAGASNPRRCGFQFRDLTAKGQHTMCEAIVHLLCIEQNKDHVALSWIFDEVFVWSMD